MLRGRAGKGHWFGTVIDAPDPRALGMFYHHVLGWEISKDEPAEFCLAVPGNSETYLPFSPRPRPSGFARPGPPRTVTSR